MMLLALLATNASLLAQMNWESGYPKLTPGVLTVEGDEGLLEIYMTTSAEVSNAQFTITIPDNMSCPGVVSENAIAYSAPAVANGKATIRVTSNGGTLPAGSTVHFKVKLKALCGVVSNGSLVVTPLSGTTTAVGDVKSEVFQTQVPSIQMTTTNKTVPYTTPDTFQPVSYKLSSMNGDAKAFKINLVVDEYTTLQTFVYGGTSITPVISADKKTYTLNLTDLSSTEKTLSFEGASSMFGNHLITPTVQYPSAKNCATVNGHVVTLSSPTIVGLPYMTRTSSAYVEDNKTTVIARADVKVDGSTRTWTKFVYENTGEVEAWNIKVVLRSQGGYTYIEDVNEIYYQLGSGALIKMPSEWITSTTIVESAPSRTYKSTVEGKTKVVSFSIPKTIKLGVNETITFYAPTINGEIYDNTVVGYYNSSYTHQFLSSEIYVTATNGAGVAGNQTANGGLHWNDISAFAKMPASFSIRQGASIIQEIPLVRGASKMKVSVKLPSWLKLDNSSGDPFVWTSSDKTYSAVENEADLTADPPYKVYTTNTWNANDIITFKYKADGFPSTESNKEGTISYWMDYDYNGQILTKIYHVTQSVTLLCEEDGAVLEDFSVYRKTRGLQDSDNNRIPDAPTADAKDGEMDMTKYLVGDKGEFRWKVRIANGASYPHLYLPVTTNDISSANIELLPTEATVSGSSIVTVEQPSANTFYVRIDGTLVGGQTVDIALPFVAKSQNAKQGSLISGCFVTNNPLDPFDSSNLSERKGKDSQDRLMGVYTFGNGMSMSSGILEFNSTDAEKKEFRPYIFAGASSLAPPYFINEVRRIYYPLSIIWELPDGYQLYGQKMVVNRAISDTQGPATKEPTVVIDGNTYTFDMASLYNTDVDSNENSLSLDDWALSDDTWSQYVTFYIQATKGVTYGSSEAKATILWKNLQTGAEETSVSAKGFYYNGLSTDLQLSTNQLYSYGSSLNIPRLSVGTPKGALDRVWVYVDGNVNNLKLTNVDGGAITNGSGAGNRWLEITTTGLAAGNVKEYTFDFNYLGRTDGKNEKDTIVIYTVSDFGDATFQDPTASALDPTDTDHVGALRRLVIIPGEARVTGSLSVDDPALTYNTPYTLTATIDGTVSPGMLRNPQIEIKIPKGQEYIPGTLSLNYAGSTAYNLSSLETVLTTDNTNSTFGPLAERTFVFSLKDILGTDVIMPGYLSSDLADTDAKRIATLTADFKPMCNTILTGIRFNGEIEAENLNTSLGRFSQSLTPANLKSYTFDVTAEVDGGNLAFNEGQTDKTLKVTIKKTVGLSAIDATDYIQLEMPAMINLKGVGTIASGAISGINGSITVDENDDTTTPGSRVIRLALPVSTINLDGDKGFNKEIVYEIPITYTVSASDGVQLIEAKYISSASFDSDCTSGAVTLGSDDVEVAILTALTDPYVVSVDESVTLGMSTTNFTGKWYSDASLSTEVSATNSYTYTPTSTETGEQTFYVSAIINGTDYGKVPVKVMVYPSLTFAVTDAAICPAGSIDLSTLVSGDAVASGTTTVLKYYESNQTTLLGSSTVSP
ncbi:hypothetical protein D0T51_11745, partial [Parabacteroides sp. 52]|uniref:hypothetical protein n=1 Tax=Parabacteroides sp. 52 TaxID=2302940 RepID=UPI0013D7A04E